MYVPITYICSTCGDQRRALGITDHVGASNPTESSARAANALKHLAISPALLNFKLSFHLLCLLNRKVRFLVIRTRSRQSCNIFFLALPLIHCTTNMFLVFDFKNHGCAKKSLDLPDLWVVPAVGHLRTRAVLYIVRAVRRTSVKTTAFFRSKNSRGATTSHVPVGGLSYTGKKFGLLFSVNWSSDC